MKKRKSLVFYFWLTFNTLVQIAVLTISGFHLWRENIHLENNLKNEGITAANTLNSAIGLYMLQENYSEISPLTYSLQSEPNIAYVIVKDQNGIAVNQKGDTTIDPENVLIEKVPLEYFQENVGEVEIALKTDELKLQKKSLLLDTIWAAIIFSILSLILSYYLSKKLTRPINNLISASKQFTDGERNVIVQKQTSIVEIEQLADAFNHMSTTIENHEKTLVQEIEKATKDLSEKIATLEVLKNISNSVLEAETQMQDVIHITLQSIRQFIQAHHVSYSFHSHRNTWEILHLNNQNMLVPFEFGEAGLPILHGIEHKKAIIRNELDKNSLSHFEQSLVKHGMKSLLMLPIIAENKVIGTLNIANNAPHFFSNTLVNQLTLFTNQIALALDRITAYESLNHAANHDFLTGLPNYRYYKKRMHEILKSKNGELNAQAAVLFIDLDRFKLVNDTFGHATGDVLLQQVAQLITECLSKDDLASRFGGDEFSILLPNITSYDDANAVAKKILYRLEKPFTIKGYEIMISASIGIAFYPENGLDTDSLLKNSDRAMYRVKSSEKNNFAIYAHNQDGMSGGNLILENDIRKGLEKNEFFVYYQPKVNIQTGKISGAEALIRWIHPKKGFISPGEFIPLAEETELIIAIGEFVLREAAKQCVTWQKEIGVSIPISVNLSIRQFFQQALISNISNILKETGVDPSLIELEITESMSMDIERSLDILLDLKKLGVLISVDDFGTGYSSLNYLRRLPIDCVKIDKSFINDMTLDENDGAIVTSIINMSHNLKLKVIAEGVETEEQFNYLRTHHCDEIQGYYISKPIPATEFEKELIHGFGGMVYV